MCRRWTRQASSARFTFDYPGWVSRNPFSQEPRNRLRPVVIIVLAIVQCDTLSGPWTPLEPSFEELNKALAAGPYPALGTLAKEISTI